MAAIKVEAPKGLLSLLAGKPPQTSRSELIEFNRLGLPEYDGKFAVLIHDLFSPSECRQLLNAAQNTTSWEPAMVNVGAGDQKLMTDVRLCGRIMWDNTEIVDRILQRITPHLPENIISLRDTASITGPGPVKRKETWKITRLNERLRFLKYTKGMYFREHMDGSYVTPNASEISFLTVHIYLNGSEAESIVGDGEEKRDSEKLLVGGATRFFGRGENFHDVNPTTGACLVFQHRALVHSGEEVAQGTKYTLRTDVMYGKVDKD